MRLYRTTRGPVAEKGGRFFLFEGADWDSLLDDPPRRLPKKPGPRPREEELLPPIGRQEVWAAGVTYLRSRQARKLESKGSGDVYARVYAADRPELFFKATPHRVSGHLQGVRIRRDSRWNVPEPELALVLGSSGRLAGYTIGNDMSSRDIEGENPLYLPQAKVYDGSCALGPGIVLSRRPPPRSTRIRMEIRRRGRTAYRGETTLGRMKRSFATLTKYLFRECRFPHGCFLLTGTGIVPPPSFTLERGDEIRISIDRVGTLVNPVL